MAEINDNLGFVKRLCITAWGKVGGNRGFGQIMPGASYFGDGPKKMKIGQREAKIPGVAQHNDFVEVDGVYERRKQGQTTKGYRVGWYVTKNPRTEAQQANRYKMRAAVAAWHSLTDEQRMIYNIESRKTRGTGFNLFVKKYMRA